MNSQQSDLSTALSSISRSIYESKQKIILVYGFNGTGKTQLSVEFKNFTKSKNNGNHIGVYYNAYSEDLFYWNNDEENDGENIRLVLQISTLNELHTLLDETKLYENLSFYNPKYDYIFKFHDDVSLGIESIQFFLKDESNLSEYNPDESGSIKFIKISRGEEQTFIWCFFLTLFEIEGWTNQRNSHFFIDDPVSSLDDHNIFVTATLLMNLIEKYFNNRKIVITTHHVGFFAILSDWITRGEKSSRFKEHTKMYILKNKGSETILTDHKKDVFLYHLELLQTLKNAIETEKLYEYHFALLRQVLENISSFLGIGKISYVLEQIGIIDFDEVARIINILAHKNVFRYELTEMVDSRVQLLTRVFEALMNKYNFVTH